MTLECECLLHPFVQEAPLLEGPHRRLCALSLQAVFRAYQESFSPRSRQMPQEMENGPVR